MRRNQGYTVKRLIKELLEFPMDMEIGVDCDSYYNIKRVRKEVSEEPYSNNMWLEIEIEDNPYNYNRSVAKLKYLQEENKALRLKLSLNEKPLWSEREFERLKNFEKQMCNYMWERLSSLNKSCLNNPTDSQLAIEYECYCDLKKKMEEFL